MTWSMDDVGKWSAYRPSLRQRRPMQVVAFGGLIIAIMCFSLLYLIELHPVVFDGTPHPTVITVTGGKHEETPTDSNQDIAILLHPEQHIHRQAKEIRLQWNITKQKLSPDGVVKSIYLINGQFPGPVVEARSGDQLVVNVYNDITEEGHPGVSIHWHGLTMHDANEMDGVVGLTQCAIQSQRKFTYQFRIPHDQAGTFWYHAHSGVQRADGLYGGLVVHKPAAQKEETDMAVHHYEKEQLFLIGDWYHRSGVEVLEWFVDPDHYGLEPAPDSLLLNGRGSYNCSMAVKAYPIDCQFVGKPAIQLMDANRVRLRIVNTGISSGFSMALSHGTMRPITVDGGHGLKQGTPRAKTIGLLHPGERLDVILDRAVAHSSDRRGESVSDPTRLTIELDKENMPLVNFALKRVQSFPVKWKAVEPGGKATVPDDIDVPQIDVFNLADAQGHDQGTETSLPQGPFQQAVLYSTMKIRAAKHNQPVGSINHTSWIGPKSNPLPLLTMERESWPDAIVQPTKAHKFDVPWFQDSGPDKWIELTLNNFDDKGHPFHLHGHEFYVMARQQATGTYRGYNPFDEKSVTEAPPLKAKSPLRKDTVHVPPMGYVVLRFPLDNAGLWLLHCHVLWHQAVGMGTVIQVGNISEQVQRKAQQGCSA